MKIKSESRWRKKREEDNRSQSNKRNKKRESVKMKRRRERCLSKRLWNKRRGLKKYSRRIL